MTRLDTYESEFLEANNIKLFIKRDDLYNISGGGNKGRKLKYIINRNVKIKHNALVTTGSNQSNHIRASLIIANELGWKSHIVIHDEKPKKISTGNLRLTELLADYITYVEMKDVAETMEKAMLDFKNDGYDPLYIWGGGHCLEGTHAYYHAAFELKEQLKGTEPNYIFLASGTGATQAGLVVGAKECFENTKVIGISIAREGKRGHKEVLKSVVKLEKYLGKKLCNDDDVIFEESYNGGGYDKSYEELDLVIKQSAKKGIILDKTYTAKAFYGMLDFIKNGKVEPNSTIVFWHTGGLLNFLS